MIVRKYLFYIVWLVVAALVITMSTVYRDGREAMVAEVESRIATVSLPVMARIDSLYVTPGQTVQAGTPLLKISRPDLSLKIRGAQYSLQLARMDSLQEVQQYEHRISQQAADYRQKLASLTADQEQLQLKRSALIKKQNVLSQLISLEDQTELAELDLKLQRVADQADDMRKQWVSQQKRQQELFDTEQQLRFVQIKEEQLKLEQYQREKAQLIQYAPFDGTVGAINVELQEITEPHDKLVSIFESNPSLIKAFTKENQTSTLRIGQQVKVTATNRSYEIEGVIESMGSRVTSYPTKINPNPNSPSYGQEVFIRISPDNRFLKGEKVYVYAIEE